MLSNVSARPLVDFIMGHEHTMVAKIRNSLSFLDKRYIAQIKTDCVLLQNVPKKHLERVKAIANKQFSDGSNMFRFEENLESLIGVYEPPSICSPDILPLPPWTEV